MSLSYVYCPNATFYEMDLIFSKSGSLTKKFKVVNFYKYFRSCTSTVYIITHVFQISMLKTALNYDFKQKNKNKKRSLKFRVSNYAGIAI